MAFLQAIVCCFKLNMGKSEKRSVWFVPNMRAVTDLLLPRPLKHFSSQRFWRGFFDIGLGLAGFKFSVHNFEFVKGILRMSIYFWNLIPYIKLLATTSLLGEVRGGGACWIFVSVTTYGGADSLSFLFMGSKLDFFHFLFRADLSLASILALRDQTSH